MKATAAALTLFGVLGAASSLAQSACSSAQQANYPKAAITNGQVQAVLYLPNTKTGYYRASRFDWSGVIPCLAFQGHTYFGIWFPHYDPMLADAIAGPVEEFRSADGALDYDQAKPGELFVKLGVGVLRKTGDAPYKFMTTYPLVDSGQWTIHTGKNAVSFRQQLQSPLGIAYDYKKTVRLDPHQPVLILEHSLKNIGVKPIESDVYDHDFFMLDGAPTAPGMVVRLPFEPHAQQELGPAAAIEGKKDPSTGNHCSEDNPHTASLLAFPSNVSDYDIVVENQNTGVGVEQTADVPDLAVSENFLAY